MSSVQELYKLITAFKRTKVAAADVGVSPTLSRTPTTVVFSPSSFCASLPQMFFEENMKPFYLP